MRDNVPLQSLPSLLNPSAFPTPKSAVLLVPHQDSYHTVCSDICLCTDLFLGEARLAQWCNCSA